MAITIDEAINILQKECCVPNSVFQEPKYQAFALSIEALEQTKELQRLPGCREVFRLPGEIEQPIRGLTETVFINPERD